MGNACFVDGRKSMYAPSRISSNDSTLFSGSSLHSNDDYNPDIYEDEPRSFSLSCTSSVEDGQENRNESALVRKVSFADDHKLPIKHVKRTSVQKKKKKKKKPKRISISVPVAENMSDAKSEATRSSPTGGFSPIDSPFRRTVRRRDSIKKEKKKKKKKKRKKKKKCRDNSTGTGDSTTGTTVTGVSDFSSTMPMSRPMSATSSYYTSNAATSELDHSSTAGGLQHLNPMVSNVSVPHSLPEHTSEIHKLLSADGVLNANGKLHVGRLPSELGGSQIKSSVKSSVKKEKKQQRTTKKPVEKWTVNDVGNWIITLGEAYFAYQQLFISCGVHGKLLVKMENVDFKDMGITNNFHIKKILMELEVLRKASRWSRMKKQKKKLQNSKKKNLTKSATRKTAQRLSVTKSSVSRSVTKLHSSTKPSVTRSATKLQNVKHLGIYE